MSNVYNLARKIDYNKTINEIENKLLMMIIIICILLLQNLINQQQKKIAARLKQANLASKSDIANFFKKKEKN